MSPWPQELYLQIVIVLYCNIEAFKLLYMWYYELYGLICTNDQKITLLGSKVTQFDSCFAKCQHQQIAPDVCTSL